MLQTFCQFLAMKRVYRQLQHEAIKIAGRYPEPEFYSDFRQEEDCSKRFFAGDKVISELWRFVVDNIEDNYGHGLEHVRNVALDAGALILIESCPGFDSKEEIGHRMRLIQAAGLLHDIRRKEKHHAAAGAKYARRILGDYNFSESDIDSICLAIANHEAFNENPQKGAADSLLISDCLYDADKFRWGPENFTRTIWSMVSYMDISFEQFISRYPRGMAYLKKIRGTFRTPTGKLYGPQFIDLGIAIGEKLYQVIQQEHSFFQNP